MLTCDPDVRDDEERVVDNGELAEAKRYNVVKAAWHRDVD